MIDTTSLDYQLADLVWMMVTALRAGYSVQQVLEQLAAEVPQPAAGACARLAAELQSGLTLDKAFANWQQKTASTYLPDIVAVMHEHQQNGGNLADMLTPVADQLLKTAGTDPAFYPAMRRLANNVGAALPARAE